MHTFTIVKDVLHKSLSFLHQKRIKLLYKTVTALVDGSIGSLYAIANSLATPVALKHRIKCVDRLLGNSFIHQSCLSLYRVVIQPWIKSLKQPIILIDWSPVTQDQQWQLLRASIALQGRSFTLYEKVYARYCLGNRTIQHDFLDMIKSVLSKESQPIIIADSGFKAPFFEKVQHMGWNWIGRIRGKVFLSQNHGNTWSYSDTFYEQATAIPRYLGQSLWAKRNPLKGHLVLYKAQSKGRKSRNLDGSLSRKGYNLKQAKREKEPWLLVYSEGLAGYKAQQIVNWYAKRMQIEQTFRDTKNEKWGLGLSQSRCKDKSRFEVMLLLIHLALFVLYCVGEYGRQHHLEKSFQSSNRLSKREISIVTLAKRMLKRLDIRLLKKDLVSIFLAFYNYANDWSST